MLMCPERNSPWKVAFVLEELGLAYESEFMDGVTLKQEPFLSVNPNGRVPAIEDPNTGVSGDQRSSEGNAKGAKPVALVDNRLIFSSFSEP